MEKEQDPYLDMTKPEERVCRICFATTTRFETPFESDLIAPCDCKGSTKWVHRACLNQWRRVNRGRRKALECEICRGRYAILKIQPNFWQYINANWSPIEKAFLRERRRRPRFVKGLSVIQTVLHFYLFGWPARSKMAMYLCIIFIIWVLDRSEDAILKNRRGGFPSSSSNS